MDIKQYVRKFSREIAWVSIVVALAGVVSVVLIKLLFG